MHKHYLWRANANCGVEWNTAQFLEGGGEGGGSVSEAGIPKHSNLVSCQRYIWWYLRCGVLQAFVEGYSDFSASQKNASKHVTLISTLSNIVDSRTLMQVLRTSSPARNTAQTRFTFAALSKAVPDISFGKNTEYASPEA